MDCVRNEDGRPTLRERGWGVLSRWLDMREKKEREKVLFLRAHGFVARGILVLECALEKEMRTWVEREKKKVQWTSGERPEHGPRCRVHLRWPQRDADARTSMLQGGEWDDPKNKKKRYQGTLWGRWGREWKEERWGRRDRQRRRRCCVCVWCEMIFRKQVNKYATIWGRKTRNYAGQRALPRLAAAAAECRTLPPCTALPVTLVTLLPSHVIYHHVMVRAW